MSERILIIEDETAIQSILVALLTDAGYTAEIAGDGLEGITKFREKPFSLVLLDILMPKIDGYTVCEMIRRESNVPVIMLTALDEEEAQIKAFELQADDYITKPFSFKEMVCRVNAQIRRYYDLNRPAANADRHFGALMISSERFEAKVNGEPLNLTAKEFKILDFLTLNQNQIFSKQKLIDAVWGIDEYIDENTVVVTIARLREKLEKAGVNNIVTIWGLGYKWQD